jgi:hypothetical protein
VLSEFYIQTSEENINIVLSQNRVFETNPEHNLLINNKERNKCETREKQVTSRSTSPHNYDTRILKHNVFVFIKKGHLQPPEHLYNR